MSRKRKSVDEQQSPTKKAKIPDKLDPDDLEKEAKKHQDLNCTPYLPEKYSKLYKQFCNLDKHLGMFHQKNTKQSFEKAQKYVEESTHYEFKEYHLSTILSFYSGCYGVERIKKKDDDSFKLYIWISDYEKISKYQLMSKTIPERKETFNKILLNYLSDKNKEYCENNNIEYITTKWNPFFKPDEVPFPEPFKLPQIPKPSLKPSIEKIMINLEEELKEEEKKMKDKIVIPELLQDYSEEFKQNYIREQIRIRCNERFTQNQKKKEENNLLLKIMDIIQSLALNGDTVNEIRTLLNKVLQQLPRAKDGEIIKNDIKELCNLLPEWGTIISFNGKQIFKCIDARNKNGNRAKLMEIIKKRNEELN